MSIELCTYFSKKKSDRFWSLHISIPITGSPFSTRNGRAKPKVVKSWLNLVNASSFVISFFVCLGSQREHTQALPKMSTDFVFVDCLSRSLPPDIGCASLNGCKWANKNNTTCHWRLPFRFRFRFQIFVGDSVEQSAQVYNAFVGFVSVLQSLINSGINYNTWYQRAITLPYKVNLNGCGNSCFRRSESPPIDHKSVTSAGKGRGQHASVIRQGTQTLICPACAGNQNCNFVWSRINMLYTYGLCLFVYRERFLWNEFP